MKKSKIYSLTQHAVLRDELLSTHDKLEILRVLFDAEELELFREKQEEKEKTNA